MDDSNKDTASSSLPPSAAAPSANGHHDSDELPSAEHAEPAQNNNHPHPQSDDSSAADSSATAATAAANHDTPPTPPLTHCQQFGGSTDSLNSTTDTVIPGEAADSSSDSSSSSSSATTAWTQPTADSNRDAPALPPRAKLPLPAGAEKSRTFNASGMFFDHSVLIRPNGQTKLVSAGGGRKSAASIMQAGTGGNGNGGVGGNGNSSAPISVEDLFKPGLFPAGGVGLRTVVSTTNAASVTQSAAVMAAANNNSNMLASANSNNSVAAGQPQQSPAQSTAAGHARVIMFCQPTSHPFQTRNILLEPNQEVKVGRSITRNRVSDNNAIFDCKVLSRNHALLWMSDGRFYIRDTASSNGTFVNDHRLSLTATSSKPYEVKTGDVVQFGVDVLENSYKEKHGCIVTMLRFCSGAEADADDLTDPAAIGRLLEANGGGKGGAANGGSAGAGVGAGGSHSLSSVELYRLNAFIQEAMQREQLLETKLMNLQKIVELTRKNSASVWHSMIEEDHLLSRIDILENKLQYFQSNVSDDKLRTEVCKLQDDKSVYQSSAKEALRKVYQERNEAVMKLSTIERALCSSEDECALLRNQLVKTQQSFREVTTQLAQLEERSVDVQEHERQLEEVRRQREQQVEELCDQLRAKVEDVRLLEIRLQVAEELCDDLRTRIETYATMEGLRSRVEEDDALEFESDDDGDDGEEPAAGGNNRQSGSSTVNKWLERLNVEAKKAREAREVRRAAGEQQLNKSNKALVDRLEGIDGNLRTLDKLLSTLKQNRESSELQESRPALLNSVQNDDNQNNATPPTPNSALICATSAVADEKTGNSNSNSNNSNGGGNNAELLAQIAGELRQVYADLLLNVAQQERNDVRELEGVQAQLKASQQENANLLGKELRATQQLLELEREAESQRSARSELQLKCDQLEQRLAEADAIASVVDAIDEAVDDDDDDDDDEDDDDAGDSHDDISPSDEKEGRREKDQPAELASIAVQTEPEPTMANGDIVIEKTEAPPEATAEPLAELAAAGDYQDDIALLCDPAVRREEELVAFKEECARLKTQAQLVEQRLADAERRLAAAPLGGGSAGGGALSAMQPVWLYAALAAVIIGYIVFSPYW